MSAAQHVKVSLVLQRLAAEISATLRHAAGEEIAFVLITQTPQDGGGGVMQYISNTARADGVLLIEELLRGWKAGRADIPAHINPDLKAAAKAAGEGA